MNGYITIRLIAENLADHPLLRDIPYDRIINYVVELIRITGAPQLFTEKCAEISIKDYRGELPCDFIEVLQVRTCKGDAMLQSMDNFHSSANKRGFVGAPSYKIQGNIIFTSIKDGDVEVAYKSMPIDSEGFPMIPDNQEFIRAIEAYIKLKRFTILFDMSQINANAFLNAQQEYAWAIGQAQTSFVRPTDDELQTLSNVVCKLIPEVQEHSTGFAFAHNRQYIRHH